MLNNGLWGRQAAPRPVSKGWAARPLPPRRSLQVGIVSVSRGRPHSFARQTGVASMTDRFLCIDHGA
jgi:hypothetical protein